MIDNNKLSQNQEEDMARYLLSCYLRIPFEDFQKGESPDFIINIEDKTVGIEVTTIHPSIMVTADDAAKNNSPRKGQNKNIIERTIKGLFYEYIERYNIYDIAIRIRLNYDLYFKSYSINNKKDELRTEINEIFQRLKHDIGGITKLKGYSYTKKLLESVDVTYYPGAGWKDLFTKDKSSINIYFTFQGFLSPMPFDYIHPLIRKKERKLSMYKQNNHDIKEFWLCLYLPSEEFAFTVKGVDCPEGYKSDYDRIIMVQDTPPFARDL